VTEDGPRAALPELAAREVSSLHRFFERWLSGTVPRDEREFQRVTSALDPGFTLVSPDGDEARHSELVPRLFALHGARPGARIWTEGFEVVAEAEELLVARYLERQLSGDVSTTRIGTVVFRTDPTAPNGVAWLRVHETWQRDDAGNSGARG
jgi:hypothetical protein